MCADWDDCKSIIVLHHFYTSIGLILITSGCVLQVLCMAASITKHFVVKNILAKLLCTNLLLVNEKIALFLATAYIFYYFL